MKLSMDGSDSQVPVPYIQKINLRHNVSKTANTTIYCQWMFFPLISVYIGNDALTISSKRCWGVLRRPNFYQKLSTEEAHGNKYKEPTSYKASETFNKQPVTKQKLSTEEAHGNKCEEAAIYKAVQASTSGPDAKW
jgi:hypothetical protein